ncbi:tRNA-dihydrouridine synthase family protein [Acidaminobacter sp. JC074]|uniref:tRNA dihydrouridine synthase n=1 Tax=Acidaminobacter sp. JC074 TaxID=2530199 RepID=UPI001F10B58F|nr:tRNA-dihydrouridine synthase family protein [Acidaminobacter sp. JC074]MCH4889547.1 tRNA-dihydrouridine synthase family protein [Acidaminobacter sp. JC074]
MKLYLAPIQGMTNAFYRNMYKELFGGIDVYYAPFISTSSVRRIGKSVFKDIMLENNRDDIEVVPQLLGNNGEDFKYYAELITQLGYREINWNIGCPYATVARKKKGSGILPYADMVDKVLDEACKGDYDITVKMRLGYEDLDEGFEVMDVLNKYPLKGVMIHGRTGIQKYEGTVDLDAFEALYKTCKHTMTYNGDIFTVDDFNRIQKRFPDIDQFMLGRGALRDPFLPAAIKGHTISDDEKVKMIQHFHDSVFNDFKQILSGDKHLCDKMKEFWTYLLVNTDPDGKLTKKLKKVRTEADYLQVVHQIFSQDKVWHG